MLRHIFTGYCPGYHHVRPLSSTGDIAAQSLKFFIQIRKKWCNAIWHILKAEDLLFDMVPEFYNTETFEDLVNLGKIN